MTDSSSDLRALVRWTRALTVLVAVLVIAIAAGAGFALNWAHQVAPAASPQAASELPRQLEERQDALATTLAQLERRTAAEVEELRTRRAQNDDVSGSPTKKMDQMIRLMQITDDELLVLLSNMAATDRALAHAVKPLEVERAAAPARDARAARRPRPVRP